MLEDVDLIAEERTRQGSGCTTLLFELLNQMDGLADDADILFVLTTNRPDLLEPALAARPGRIDQAIEVPLPDADCRRRLFELGRFISQLGEFVLLRLSQVRLGLRRRGAWPGGVKEQLPDDFNRRLDRFLLCLAAGRIFVGGFLRRDRYREKLAVAVRKLFRGRRPRIAQHAGRYGRS